jgi:hypothetical protein
VTIGRALPDSVRDEALRRLKDVLPNATDVDIRPGQPLHCLNHMGNRFALKIRRDGSTWVLREFIRNGTPVSLTRTVSDPSFSDLLLQVISPGTPPPRVKIVDLRCPVEHRRLFGKLLTTQEKHPRSNLLEFACPQCKRSTGLVTMHYFDTSDGKLVKTEALEPWTPRASRPTLPNQREDRAA